MSKLQLLLLRLSQVYCRVCRFSPRATPQYCRFLSFLSLLESPTFFLLISFVSSFRLCLFSCYTPGNLYPPPLKTIMLFPQLDPSSEHKLSVPSLDDYPFHRRDRNRLAPGTSVKNETDAAESFELFILGDGERK